MDFPCWPHTPRLLLVRRWNCCFLGTTLCAIVSAFPLNALAQVVITHPSITEDVLSRTAARAIFSGRLHTLGDQRLTVFVFDDNHPTHVAFSKDVLGVFPYQLRQAWNRAVFTGSGNAPITVASEADMVRRVGETSGGIGYVSEHGNHEILRILAIEGTP